MGWTCPVCGIDNNMSKMVCGCGYKASIESDLMEIAKKSEMDKKITESNNPKSPSDWLAVLLAGQFLSGCVVVFCF